ncbi:diguanylate cyclase/phosphodiesterase [Mycobacterium tuberculosis]|nr:diguanylate cyclase/phosphodiesterase [Mycobacterium tuberculosis]
MIDYEEMFRGAMQARAMVANPDQWADSDRDQVNTRHYLSTSMRVALDRGEFFLVYQPIIRLADNRIIGAEALLRWEHPTLGTLLPGRFIDRAENNGLMVPLTAFVLERPCRHVRSWRDHSTDPQPFVSVNVSASTICDPGFLVLVEGVLGETGLPAHALQLELAEDARLSRDEKAVTRLQELSALGVGIAIDDFGIGFSSLAYLPRLPVDVVKLGGKFIECLDGDIQARLANEQITRAMIDLGDKLGITVTAKLVETPSQAARLRAFGCKAAQGWHFAKALPVDFFRE